MTLTPSLARCRRHSCEAQRVFADAGQDCCAENGTEKHALCCRWAGELLFVVVFSDRGSGNTGAAFQKPSEKTLFSSDKLHRGRLPEIIEENFVFYMRARSRSSSSRKSRRNMVLFRVKSVCPFLPVFTPRSFFWSCLVPHRHFCASRYWFSRSSSIFRVWLGTKRIRCWVRRLTPCQCVCEVCHVLCQHHFRLRPLCFCVFVYCFDMFFR